MTMRSTKPVTGVSMLVAALTAAACSSVRVESGPVDRASLEGLSTYAMMPTASGGGDVSAAGDAEVDRIITRAITDELHRRGYRSADPDEATFLVAHRSAVEDRRINAPARDNYIVRSGSRLRYDPGYLVGEGDPALSASPTYDYTAGTIIVEMTDPTTGRPIWRGLAEGAVGREGTIAERTANVGRMIRRMFERFPAR